MPRTLEPTCTVRTEIFPLRKRPLSQVERDNLAPGQVFVWTESIGLESWTDGRKWRAGRLQDVFLIHDERVTRSAHRNVERARMDNSVQQPARANGSGNRSDISAIPKERTHSLGTLTKQTFSAWVNVLSTGQRVKWHLSAYSLGQNPDNTATVDTHTDLVGIQVPDGIYECCTNSRRNLRSSQAQRAPRNPSAASEPHQQRRIQLHHREPSPTPPLTSMRSEVKSEIGYWMPSTSSTVLHPPHSTIPCHVYVHG
ncbi:hypothetical protein DL93DRAFT_95540 [Clavulina sp. PMI_390]|nr:hypothetical protein DL93DRAFT_95540 [Clavulina sp. PMI_390]